MLLYGCQAAPNGSASDFLRERAALAGELIQSLEGEVDADAEAAWSAEIRTRLDQVDAGTATTIPWSEARSSHPRRSGRDPRA